MKIFFYIKSQQQQILNMASIWLIIPSLILIFAITLSSCHPKVGGDNVCNKTVHNRRVITVEEPIKYELKYQGTCGFLPCTKTRIEHRMDTKKKTIFDSIQVATCCPGYAEAPDGQCQPICLKSCNHGKCIRPGTCECSPRPVESSPGYTGSLCNRFVCEAANRWGSTCDKECNCPPNSYCSANTGKCLCHTGWRGANCTEECDSTMNCDNAELPPFIEPEVNVIHGAETFVQSQKLEAPRALEIYTENEDETARSNSVSNLIATHMGINLLLTIFTFLLICTILWYKRRLHQVEDKLYYSAVYSSSPPSQGNNSSSEYSAYSIYSGQGGVQQPAASRPRMPIPGELVMTNEKGSNFASATRNVLATNKSENRTCIENARDKIVVDPRVELHLIASQKSSKQNIYSDIESNNISFKESPSDSSFYQTPMLNISITSAESNYQVPRSPTSPAIIPTVGQRGDEIYEEIIPRTPDKNDKLL